jgi:hypothetical protein
LELTALTLEDLRRDLGPLRSAGRTLQDRLQASAQHQHLLGRVVRVTSTAEPRELNDELDAVVELLKQDKGSLNDIEMDLSDGLPAELPNAGFYGSVGGLVVDVNGPPGRPDTILVSASCRAKVRQTEALELMASRVTRKDDVRNDILLVTCGLPDKRGYVCAADPWIFETVAEAAGNAAFLPERPKHLTAVVLHHQADGRVLELYRQEDAVLPWT